MAENLTHEQLHSFALARIDDLTAGLRAALDQLEEDDDLALAIMERLPAAQLDPEMAGDTLVELRIVTQELARSCQRLNQRHERLSQRIGDEFKTEFK